MRRIRHCVSYLKTEINLSAISDDCEAIKNQNSIICFQGTVSLKKLFPNRDDSRLLFLATFFSHFHAYMISSLIMKILYLEDVYKSFRQYITIKRS